MSYKPHESREYGPAALTKRIVFAEEVGQSKVVVIVSGEVTQDIVDALNGFVNRRWRPAQTNEHLPQQKVESRG